MKTVQTLASKHDQYEKLTEIAKRNIGKYIAWNITVMLEYQVDLGFTWQLELRLKLYDFHFILNISMIIQRNQSANKIP